MPGVQTSQQVHPGRVCDSGDKGERAEAIAANEVTQPSDEPSKRRGRLRDATSTKPLNRNRKESSSMRLGCYAVNKLAGADVRRLLNFLFFKARFKLCLFARIGDNRPWVFAFTHVANLCGPDCETACQISSAPQGTWSHNGSLSKTAPQTGRACRPHPPRLFLRNILHLVHRPQDAERCIE